MTITGEKIQRLFTDEDVVLEGEQGFYADCFDRCRIILTPNGDPKFLLCVFRNCTFTPPFLTEPFADDDCWAVLRCNSNLVLFE
jgi:hypothetical protein